MLVAAKSDNFSFNPQNLQGGMREQTPETSTYAPRIFTPEHAYTITFFFLRQGFILCGTLEPVLKLSGLKLKEIQLPLLPKCWD